MQRFKTNLKSVASLECNFHDDFETITGTKIQTLNHSEFSDVLIHFDL